VAPHVVIGINRGRIESEYEALDLIAREDPEALILVVFTPTQVLLRHDSPS